MAKLYFRYGTVGAAKTLNLLAVAHTYISQGKHVVLIKPAIDTRFGANVIQSRAGMSCEADIVIPSAADAPSYDLFQKIREKNIEKNNSVACILVDEAQFLSYQNVRDLREITILLKIPVICYGLRTDFRLSLFSGSKVLMEIADQIEEVKTTCYFCKSKATCNWKHYTKEGKSVLNGPTIELGTENLYLPTCFDCYTRQMDEEFFEKTIYKRQKKEEKEEVTQESQSESEQENKEQIL